MATAAAPKPTTAPALAPAGQGGGLYRMSLEQYHEIAEAGILGPKDRVVLVDGLLVSKMTKGPEHSSSATIAHALLAALLPEGWHVRKEDPVSLPEGPSGPSEPEPGLAVVRGTMQAYTRRHPLPDEVALIIEVSKSSLRFDREMLARYAWASIPVVWIINLVSRVVEVYSDPTGPGEDPRYRTAETVEAGGQLRVILAGEDRGAIAAQDLLPRADRP